MQQDVFSPLPFFTSSGFSQLPVFDHFWFFTTSSFSISGFPPLPVFPHFRFRPKPEVEKPEVVKTGSMLKPEVGLKLLKWGQIIKKLFYLSALELFCCLLPLFLLSTSFFLFSTPITNSEKKLQNLTKKVSNYGSLCFFLFWFFVKIKLKVFLE